MQPQKGEKCISIATAMLPFRMPTTHLVHLIQQVLVEFIRILLGICAPLTGQGLSEGFWGVAVTLSEHARMQEGTTLPRQYKVNKIKVCTCSKASAEKHA